MFAFLATYDFHCAITAAMVGRGVPDAPQAPVGRGVPDAPSNEINACKWSGITKMRYNSHFPISW